MKQVAFFVVLSLLLSIAIAEDPANDWLAYAKAVNPSGTGVITYIEAKWVVCNDPVKKGGFFAPWFGIEASDNLNLLQPVNPWSGTYWEIYNEYFQWEPTYNQNSRSSKISTGDVILGSATFNPTNQSYTLYVSNTNNSWSISMNIGVQKQGGYYKNYTIAYFVLEKEWPCEYYPPDNLVTFYDIVIEYDNQAVTPTWTTSYVLDHCDCRAHINNSSSVSITWNSQKNSTVSDPSIMLL